MQKLIRTVVLVLIVTLLGESASLVAHATPQSSFSPPTHIRVNMFVLQYPSGAITSEKCQDNDTRYGCTAHPDLGSYPWSGASYQNPVTVAIEGTAPDNRYLLDVVPRESGPDAFHPTAVQAQAIAARTYVYWHSVLQTKAGIPEPLINNSNAIQVFVPYWYNIYTAIYGSTLGAAYQQVVNTALADRFYLSNNTGYLYYDPLYSEGWVWMEGDDPIFAEFFADIPLRTVTNPTFTYQVQVEDPISSHPDVVQDGHGRGMSQKGTSRWARGNLSFNINNDLGAWSVSWPDRFQILTHYYTGIHVRNAASPDNAILTPQRRFAVINASVNGRSLGEVTARVCAHQVYALTVVLQNTGTVSWYASDTGLGYCWGDTCTRWGLLPQSVAPGATVALTIPIQPGAGRLSVDLYYQNGWWPYAYQWFSAGVSGDRPWFRQPLDPLLMQCRQRLPTINNRWQPQS